MPTLEEVLTEFRQGKCDMAEVLDYLRRMPYENIAFARVDHHRRLRRGYPEVVFGQGKTPEQIVTIVEAMRETENHVLITRVSENQAEHLRVLLPQLDYHPAARMLTLGERPVPRESRGVIQVLCAGSSDIPVAEEAVVTAQFMANRVQRFYDVGVAGLHRLLDLYDELRKGSVYVVVAGMEGALPSVVGGLVGRPVIAVPTSVGYGASFGGVAALLGMLNSCAPGMAVVNIDNGFGAGYLASLINEGSNDVSGKPDAADLSHDPRA